jgi:hypothetical protein
VKGEEPVPQPSPMEVRPLGSVRSALKRREEPPRQGREGAPLPDIKPALSPDREV